VSKAGASPGPLCLVQHCSSSGASLMVGTLFEGVYSTEISSSSEHSQEQVLLVMVSLHLSDLIWKMLELGGSPTSQLGHQIFPSDDPIYGNASIIPCSSQNALLCLSNRTMKTQKIHNKKEIFLSTVLMSDCMQSWLRPSATLSVHAVPFHMCFPKPYDCVQTCHIHLGLSPTQGYS
jgi:hypothetical protein